MGAAPKDWSFGIFGATLLSVSFFGFFGQKDDDQKESKMTNAELKDAFQYIQSKYRHKKAPEYFIKVWSQYLASATQVETDQLKVHAACAMFGVGDDPELLAKFVDRVLHEVPANRTVNLLSVCIALWQLGTPQALELLDKIEKRCTDKDYISIVLPYNLKGKNMKQVIQGMKSTPAPWREIGDMVVYGPADLDILWNHFYLTGDSESLRRLSTYIIETHEQMDPVSKRISEYATISVSVSASLYPDVLLFLEHLFCTKEKSLVDEQFNAIANCILAAHTKNLYMVPSPQLLQIPEFGIDLVKRKMDYLWPVFSKFPPPKMDNVKELRIKNLFKRLMYSVLQFPEIYMVSYDAMILAAKIGIVAYNLQLPLAYNKKYKHFPALVWLDKCLQLAPENPKVNRIAGLFALQIGNLETAVKMLSTAADNGDVDSCLQAAVLIGHFNPVIALNYMQEYLEKHPERAEDSNIKALIAQWEDGKATPLTKIAYKGTKEVSRTTEPPPKKKNAQL